MRKKLLFKQMALLLLLVVPFAANAQDMYRNLAALLEKVSTLPDEELATKPTLKMAGELTVSLAYTEGDESFCYVQDNTAGVRVGTAIPDFMSGSILGGATLVANQDRSLQLTAVDYDDHDPAEPEAALAEGVGELVTMPDGFLYRLVQLEGVTLQPADGAAEFVAGMQVPFTDVEGEAGVLRVFAGSELVGEPIPAGAITLTGVFVEINGEELPVIAPRSSADLGGGEQVEMMSVAEMLEAVALLTPEEIAGGMTYTLADPVVTFSYEGAEALYCYMEDVTAAVRVEAMEPYEIGDMLSGATVEVMDYEGETVLMLTEVAEVAPTDGVEPMEFTLAELVEEDPAMMENRLVKIANALIEPEDENMVEFSADAPVEFIDEDGVQTGVFTTALIQVFAGTDVEGTEIPFDPIPLTGLVSYNAGRDMYVISPRSLADLQENVVADPGIRIETANGSYAGYACVGEKLATYYVSLEAGVEEDITIGFDNEYITCDHETVSVADAARGVNVYFDITVRKEGNDSTIVTYSSGEYVVKDTIRWLGTAADYEGTIAGARTYFDEAGGMQFMKKIRLTGEMVVSYAEKMDFGYRYFVQDETGGIILRHMAGGDTPAYQAGDVVSGVLGQMMAFEQNMYILRMITMPDVTEQGRAEEAVDVTAEAMQAVDGKTPVEYQSRMLRLSGVTFVPEGVTVFAKDQMITLSQGEYNVTVMVKGDDLVGEPIPMGVVTVTGLSVRGDRPAIYLLSKNDITEGVNGICSPVQIDAAVWCRDNTVFVEADGLQGMDAYTLTGVKVASSAGTDRIGLPSSGAYLVKISTTAGTAVRKVLVK